MFSVEAALLLLLYRLATLGTRATAGAPITAPPLTREGRARKLSYLTGKMGSGPPTQKFMNYAIFKMSSSVAPERGKKMRQLFGSRPVGRSGERMASGCIIPGRQY